MKSSTTILLVLIGLLIFSLLTQLHFEKDRSVSGNLELPRFEKYTTSYPIIDNVNYIGSDDASLSIIVFLDSTIDIEQLSSFLRHIEQNYTSSNRARLYLRPTLTASDVRENNERLTWATRLLCLQNLEEYTIQSTISYFENSQEIEDSEVFTQCISGLKTEDFELIATETQMLGLEGINARVYIGIGNNYNSLEGIPSPQRLSRIVRLKEITVGT